MELVTRISKKSQSKASRIEITNEKFVIFIIANNARTVDDKQRKQQQWQQQWQQQLQQQRQSSPGQLAGACRSNSRCQSQSQSQSWTPMHCGAVPEPEARIKAAAPVATAAATLVAAIAAAGVHC